MENEVEEGGQQREEGWRGVEKGTEVVQELVARIESGFYFIEVEEATDEVF